MSAQNDANGSLPSSDVEEDWITLANRKIRERAAEKWKILEEKKQKQWKEQEEREKNLLLLKDKHISSIGEIRAQQMREKMIWEEKVERRREEDKRWGMELKERLKQIEDSELAEEDEEKLYIEEVLKIGDGGFVLPNDGYRSYNTFVNQIMADFNCYGMRVTSVSLGLLTAFARAGRDLMGYQGLDGYDKIIVAQYYFRAITQMGDALVGDLSVNRRLPGIIDEIKTFSDVLTEEFTNEDYILDFRSEIEAPHTPLDYDDETLDLMSRNLIKVPGSGKSARSIMNCITNQPPQFECIHKVEEVKEEDKKKCIALTDCETCKADKKCILHVNEKNSSIVCDNHLQRWLAKDLDEKCRIDALLQTEPTGMCIALRGNGICHKDVLVGKRFCLTHYEKYTNKFLLKDEEKCPRLIKNGKRAGGICGKKIWNKGVCFGHQEHKIEIQCGYFYPNGKRKGERCSHKTTDGKQFCGHHIRGPKQLPPTPVKCKGICIDGTACNKNGKFSSYCGKHLKQCPTPKEEPTNPIVLQPGDPGYGEEQKEKVKAIPIVGNRLIKFRCLAVTKDKRQCSYNAKDGSDMCGHHKNYTGPKYVAKITIKEPVVTVEEKDNTTSAVSTAGNRKIVVAPRRMKKVLQVVDVIEEIENTEEIEDVSGKTEEEIDIENQKQYTINIPNTRIVKVEKFVEVEADSDEEMEDIELPKLNLTEEDFIDAENQQRYLLNNQVVRSTPTPKRTPAVVNKDDIAAITELTDWTEDQLNRMKALKIYSRKLNADKTLNVEETIVATRAALTEYFKVVDNKCRANVASAKDEMKAFSRAKELDIQNSLKEILQFERVADFKNREKEVMQCRIARKHLVVVNKTRTKDLSGLPEYDGNYQFPDVIPILARLREGACVASLSNAVYRGWGKIYRTNLNLQRKYRNFENDQQGANAFIQAESNKDVFKRDKEIDKNNEDHEWLLTYNIHCIMEYRQARFEANPGDNRIDQFKEYFMGCIRLAQRYEGLDLTNIETLTRMKFEDWLDHILTHYYYDISTGKVLPVEGDESKMSMSPKFIDRSMVETDKSKFLRIKLSEPVDKNGNILVRKINNYY